MQPKGNYGVTFVLLRNCQIEDFELEQLEKYVYKVVTELHKRTATKALHAKYPTKHASVYCGLNKEETLWLASRHNITTAIFIRFILWFI